jgi:uncharacterized protein (DUF697 family)
VERGKKTVSINTQEQRTAAHPGAAIAEPEMAQAKPVSDVSDAMPEEKLHSAPPEADQHPAEAAHEPDPGTHAQGLQGELRRLQCDMTIAKHVTASVGAGFIPVPVVDFAAVTAVQVDMVYRLCKIYGVDFSKEAARTAIVTLIGASLPGLQARFFSSGLKLIPGVGTILGMVATPTVSGAATYAVGRVFVQHLDTGGSLLDFDASKMKEQFERALQQGKNMTTRARSAKA